jgi:20S proteasome alpha/beta subunit
MTVLVGVKCKGGVVIGADSATTFASGQFRTIEQTGKKIHVIADKILVAGTGELGLGQRFCAQVKAAHDGSHFKGQRTDVGRTLCAMGVNDFAQTKAPMGAYGALVAFPLNNAFELCEFQVSNFQPEFKTDDIWYVSMGSGQPIADPCLGFIRQAFWNDGMPSVEDGVFAVVWTLAQAIKLNPGGINAPMQVGVLTNNHNGKAHAHLLNDDEIAQHTANVDGAIQHLCKYRTTLNAADAPKPPEPPKPA